MLCNELRIQTLHFINKPRENLLVFRTFVGETKSQKHGFIQNFIIDFLCIWFPVCVSVAEIWGGGQCLPLFLRTEQFNLKLELFLAIYQRMEVAFNYRAFLYYGTTH